MRPCEQTRCDLLVTLGRALCLLDGPFLLEYSAADHTWFEAARADLRASVELICREPFEDDACTSAAELTAKAGLCLASVPAAHRDASMRQAARLIAEVHATLAGGAALIADAVMAE